MENNKSNNNENEIHTYDDIAEENHPMPGWWIWTFILTVIFAFHYLVHFELTHQGKDLKQELAISMEELKNIQAAAANKFPILKESELEAKLKDPNLIKTGASVFQAKCAMCHGEKLEGKIGPSLIDAVWIHGNKNEQIVQIVRQGVSAKGMPAWEGLLKAEEIFGVVALIKSKGL